MESAVRRWVYLRNGAANAAALRGGAGTEPVTVRTLESLLRLAVAHAKARLSPHVEASDCDAAGDLAEYALNGVAPLDSAAGAEARAGESGGA